MSARDKTQTLSVVTDVLLVGTVASAGVATFFTIKAMRSAGETKNDAPSSASFPRLRGEVAGSGVLLSGWF